MKTPIPDAQGWYNFEGEPTAEAIRSLSTINHIEKLSVTKSRLLTVNHVKHFHVLKSVRWMWLWCDITRTAMRHVLRVPGLEVLDVLDMTAPGKLEGFGAANTLHTVRANHYLKEADVLAITECSTIRELGIQKAELTPNVINALLTLKQLKVLDLEGTNFDDSMAARLNESKTLQELNIGDTYLTRIGLQEIISMKQLRSLDLWAIKFNDDDLQLLLQLPQLEYLSVGNYDGLQTLDSAKLVALLLSLPSLKSIWLDGITVTDNQKIALEAKLESVRITNVS
jgi:hypothetical protein